MVALQSLPALRGLFAGAGSAMMGSSLVVDAVLKLTGKPNASDVTLVYLGTATYDLERFRSKQCGTFMERGVDVRPFDVACATPALAEVEEAIEAADVVMVSGGNTLFAVERWQRAQMVEPLRRAMLRGAVMCGGSAGAICWFDGGHSDSADPDWFREPMLAGRGAAAEGYGVGPPKSPEEAQPWEYVRVNGLGFLPGLICPHHDRTQSNGVLRAEDFAGMLLRHPGEQGVCIDHFAALVVDGEDYAVLALDGKPGTLVAGGTEPDFSGAGTPAIWLKSVEGGRVVAKAAPAAGKLADILRKPTAVVDDARIARAREENPSNVERP